MSSTRPFSVKGNKYLAIDGHFKSSKLGKKNKYLQPVDLIDDALIESEIRYEFELGDASNFSYKITDRDMSQSAAVPGEMVNPHLSLPRSSFESVNSATSVVSSED